MNKPVLPTDDDIAQAQRESGWTDLRTRIAFALFASGMSDSQVACVLGGVTRNAVIGKRCRSGMFVGVTPETAGRPRIKCDNGRRAGEPKPPREAAPKRFIAPKQFKAEEPPRVDDLAIPAERRRSLFDLTDQCCHWPVGEPGRPDFFFCGAAVRQAEGARFVPYCPSHMRRAHDAPRSRRSAEDLVPRLSRARANDIWH